MILDELEGTEYLQMISNHLALRASNFVYNKHDK